MLKAIVLSAENDPAPLIDILEEGRLFEIEQGIDPETLLADPEASFDYDLFIIDGRPPVVSHGAQLNFDHSLASGAGLLLIRAATDPARPWPLIERLAIWLRDGVTQASVHQRIQFLDHYHPVTRGLRDFEIDDFPVKALEIPHPAVHQILATASPCPTLATEWIANPAFISTSHGRGRVFHSMLNADAPGEPIRRTLARAAEWAATGNVLDF
ncbi:MAG: hypothetical protein P4L33_09010 [Capsulimonadaceae bacterium]|nr:hypothetical protein [Capsulimonadaceae bacterium]